MRRNSSRALADARAHCSDVVAVNLDQDVACCDHAGGICAAAPELDVRLASDVRRVTCDV